MQCRLSDEYLIRAAGVMMISIDELKYKINNALTQLQPTIDRLKELAKQLVFSDGTSSHRVKHNKNLSIYKLYKSNAASYIELIRDRRSRHNTIRNNC